MISVCWNIMLIPYDPFTLSRAVPSTSGDSDPRFVRREEASIIEGSGKASVLVISVANRYLQLFPHL